MIERNFGGAECDTGLCNAQVTTCRGEEAAGLASATTQRAAAAAGCSAQHAVTNPSETALQLPLQSTHLFKVLGHHNGGVPHGGAEVFAGGVLRQPQRHTAGVCLHQSLPRTCMCIEASKRTDNRARCIAAAAALRCAQKQRSAARIRRRVRPPAQ